MAAAGLLLSDLGTVGIGKGPAWGRPARALQKETEMLFVD
jgi:hypothetical protein